MVALRMWLLIALAAHAAGSVGLDAHAEGALENSCIADSCPEVALLQTELQFLQNEFDHVAARYGEDCGGTPSIFSEVPALHGSRNISLEEREDIIWIHLHNFGGTTMCEEASKQGEHVPNLWQRTGINCDVGTDVCSADKEKHVHCEKRAGWTFSAIERALTEEDLSCKDKIYGIVLRDPLAGARSTFVNNCFDEIDKQNILSAIRTGGSDVSAHTGHRCLPDWDTYQHFDNFATRTLSGDYMVPAGMMEIKHLEKAKSRLQNMDVIMILEELDGQSVQLEAMFGWDMANGFGKPSNSHSQELRAEAFTAEEAEFLKTANQFDYELYAFGASLAANRTAAARLRLGA